MPSLLYYPTVLAAAAILASAQTSGLGVDLGYSIYQGLRNETTDLNVWKGIRFAAPPTEALRWQAPQPPVEDRTEPIPATSPGPICPQVMPAQPNAFFIPGDEDCLFLNVYAPPPSCESAEKSLLPVLVWIHGGGYGFGDGRQDMSEIINDGGRGFVVVAVQYRLGAFGFLSSADVHEKGVVNAGLLDQLFALEWVQKHIELFGGDPARVTVSGESAGGGSIMLHSLAKGGQLGTSLFVNAIAASPYLPPQYNYDDAVPTSRYIDFAREAGCGPPAASEAVFECLVEKDSMILQQASFNVSTTQLYGTWAFLPVTGGSYIQRRPSEQLSTGSINGQRILVGNNADEGPMFVPLNITTIDNLIDWTHTVFPNFSDEDVNSLLEAYPSSDEPTDPDAPKYPTSGHGPTTAINVSLVATGQQQRANNIYAEATFICPSYWLAEAYSTIPNKDNDSNSSSNFISYKYQYSIPLALHTEDIPAYFGPARPNQGPEFTRTFRTMWANFITKNDPSITSTDGNDIPTIDWPPFSTRVPRQLNLNQTGGTPYEATRPYFPVPVTQYGMPGLESEIVVVDAYEWEGGRGKRCEFWKGVSGKVPM
ncbi:hypothetical protein AJ79_00024 [Helicocarpus griseus UAMH5409]|uniref:Carboxylic ester hydrolase n=1 Tax=Helicocarpus griseus UAMH5409 TaxID=1447875 RepID=A0A2B7YD54_9EURO|nr:hypothetical protein AJ79_00024 [Helicocarpus griseus UAMH5409]